MRKEIFDKNIEALKEKYKDKFEVLKDYNVKEDKVFVDESMAGEKILAVKQDGHMYYLNSRYRDVDFISNWIKTYDTIKYKEVFIIFGLSNFLSVKELIKKIGDNNAILLYEPDIDIFYNAIHITDISDAVKRDNVILCVNGMNDECLKEFLLFLVDYDNMKLMNYVCMPNYSSVYGNEWKEVISDIKTRCEGVVAVRNTFIKYGKEFINNQLDNCKDIIYHNTLNQVKDILREKNIENIPAIIVAAGPSLNKNIKDLKKAEKKAYIFAADTALKALLSNDIIPDLVMTIDAHKPPILFAHKGFFKIPMVVSGISNSKLWHIHNGKRIYFGGGDSLYISAIYKKIKKERLQPLESGGSVANDIFSMAHILGFKKIILVGQDLAYPDNKGHVSEAYMGAEEKVKKISDNYVEVEDIYGNKVLTELNMNIYREWFESQLERYTYLDVTDATEGGAKIKGTKIMTLSEVIEKECKSDISKIKINDIEKEFDEKQIKELEEKLEFIEEELEELKKQIEKGIRKYERLYELSRKNKEASKEFKNVMTEIDDIIKEIEDIPVFEITSLYSKVAEYELLGVVNDIKDNVKDEIKDAVDNGIKMLQAYIEGVSSFKKDLNERKVFDQEKFDKLLLSLRENVKSIENAVNSSDDVEINTLMKQFLLVSLDLIDILYKSKFKNYKVSTEFLKEIIVDYTDKNYKDMSIKMNTGFVKAVADIYGEKD